LVRASLPAAIICQFRQAWKGAAVAETLGVGFGWHGSLFVLFYSLFFCTLVKMVAVSFTKEMVNR